MPKIPHRTFEIYESADEATRAMTPKSGRPPTASAALATAIFEHLIVSSAEVTHVRFKEAEFSEEAAAGGLRKDFAQLTDRLGIDSKVLVDFTGVESFGASFIDALVLLSKQLRTRGSRIALCCLGPTVKPSFFASDERR
ncbi:MAG: hypothetical protein KJ000_00905 [Pirellulaceae bacterium]|nr:hypothetical protein [Pirellulaceae bacterium]